MDATKSISRPFGFTLIELLVVISIIALLLSILMPALAQVKKQAQRLVCRSNIHQWYLGHSSYAADNKGTMMESYGWKSTSGVVYPGRWPGEIVFDSEFVPTGIDYTGIVSTDKIVPYVGGFNPEGLSYADVVANGASSSKNKNNLTLNGIWQCPANKKESPQDTYNRITTGNRNYLRLQIAYFMGADKFSTAGGFSHGVTDWRDIASNKNLNGRQVILGDFLLYWDNINPGPMLYNHGLGGPSSESINGELEFLSHGYEPEIAGANFGYGDGSAVWRARNDFDLENMSNSIQSKGSNWVVGDGRAKTYYLTD